MFRGPRPESANLRAELARQGVTQWDVAHLLGINQSNVSWRLRSRNWKPGELEKLARYLEVPIEALKEEDERINN